MTPDRNYVADRNPFALAKPPSWWLAKMADFDPDLVLLPSRRKPVHILARRRKYSPPLPAVVRKIERSAPVDDPGNALDSRLCESYGLVCCQITLACAGEWTEDKLRYFLAQLQARDTWQFGGPLTPQEMQQQHTNGGSVLARRLDAHDRAQDARIDQDVRQDLYHATGDAWRSRQVRRGERILNAGSASRLSRPSVRAQPHGRLTGV